MTEKKERKKKEGRKKEDKKKNTKITRKCEILIGLFLYSGTSL